MGAVRMNHKSEVIHSMDGKIKPCPICGSEFELWHESYDNSNGHTVNTYYWMQKRDDYCLLEEILCNAFAIGSGDTNLGTGYVGEYGERWNKALSQYESKIRNDVIDEVESLVESLEDTCVNHTENEDGEWVTLTMDYETWSDLSKLLYDLRGLKNG